MKCMLVGGARAPRFWVGLLIVGLMTTGVTACGKAKPAAEPTTTTSTSTTIPALDAQILNAYGQFWTAYLAAGKVMDPGSQQFADHATGAELASVKKAFLGYKLDGDVLVGTIEPSATVVTKSETTATVRDCSFDRSHIQKAATGAPVGSTAESHELLLVTMVVENGAWKVSAIDHQGSGCSG